MRLPLRVRCAVVVCRHGDRSPAFNLFDAQHGGKGEDGRKGDVGEELPPSMATSKVAHNADEVLEKQLWSTKVAPKERLVSLSKRFPVVQVTGNDASRLEAPPEHRRPLPDEDPTELPFGRITSLGLDQLFRRGLQLRDLYKESLGLGNADSVLAFSTDFSRTQHSAQSLLHGLFHGVELEKPVLVGVPPSSRDVANSWEAHEALRRAIREQTQSDPFFEEAEARCRQAREALTHILPYYSFNPDRFLWIYSCDYFVCRVAHGLGLDPRLEPFESTVLNLTIQRFLRWYHVPHILDLASGDLLRTIRAYMESSLRGLTGKKLLVYSGHDITIMPLLCALRQFENRRDSATFAQDWPKYSSMLCFELLTPAQDDQGEVFVRVLYNNKELLAPQPFNVFWDKQVRVRTTSVL